MSHRLFGNYYLCTTRHASRSSCQDYSPDVLVLYLERPAVQRCAIGCSLVGRFGYSDLKEAAHMEAYVL